MRDDLDIARGADALMKPEEVMARLGYTDRETFMRMARVQGLPRVRINKRVIRFDRMAVAAWIKRRGS
jgi:predicted DNA-binding transcriptional regulator AlpA